MLTTLEGIVRNGKIELIDYPDTIAEDTRVLITVLPRHHQGAHGLTITRDQAADLRQRLACFAEDWLHPSMDGYDDYDTASTHL